MNNKEILIESGLTDSEAKVYLALLEEGPTLAGTISRRTGIHRRNIYDITERLIKKGFVGYILENNRRLFEAVNPEKILDTIKVKEQEFKENLPQLKELYKKTKEKQETNFYKGVEGLKTIFQDQLEESKEVLILGASEAAFQTLPFYFKWYDKTRIQKRIKAKIITSEKLKRKIPFSETKILPQGYSNPMAINIYKDKVAIILWKKEPMAILIKNLEIAESYRKYFELIWRIAKKV